jgi:hypothetical protein
MPHPIDPSIPGMIVGAVAGLIALPAVVTVAVGEWRRANRFQLPCLVGLSLETLVIAWLAAHEEPGWTLLLGVACVGVLLSAWFVGLVLTGDGRDDDDGGGGGGRGFRGGGPGPRPRPGDPDEPAWWPQFERELRTYVRARSATRDRRPVHGHR